MTVALHRTLLADAVARITLRPYQQKLRDDVEHHWAMGAKNVLAVLPTGGGKCLGRDTPVLMFDGTIKAVQDVIVGDLLMGPDSTPRTVLSLARGRELMYRVKPVKGDSYIVNESHILSLKRTGEASTPKYPCEMRAGEIVNISVSDYVGKSKNFKHLHKGWRTGVDWPVAELPTVLPPYMLGLWLGDGHTDRPSITTADREVVQYIKDYCDVHSFRLSTCHQQNNASSVYNISTKWKREGSILAALRDVGVYGNKHIPHVYKTGSREQRLHLLAGILDSDGYLHHGHYDVVFKVEQLARDLTFLCRSLGFAAYLSPCRKTCTNNGVTGDYFRVIISGDVSVIPTRLARHQPEPRRQKKSVLVTGITLERLDEDDYYGFEIDGDRLFLLGDFTVTHNTALFSTIMADEPHASCAVAHRQELVSQISLALARNRVRHRIIGPQSVVKMIVRLHMEEVGASYYDPSSKCAVAGIDTLVRRGDQLASWLPTVKLWVMDEAHHVLVDNKWGKGTSMFPNARGLGVTAWTRRADGMGLGRHADGVMDALAVGPTQRELINMGHLTDYKLFAPKSDFDRSSLTKAVSKTTGEISAHASAQAVATSSLVAHVEKGQLTGDLVRTYRKLLDGLLTITFAPDIATATQFETEYNAAGIPAKMVHGGSGDEERYQALRKFRDRGYLVLVNVGLFGEGFDLPAIEAVQDAAATESSQAFVQRAGRMLRPLPGKKWGIYVDHVGNIARHATVVHYPDGSRVEIAHGEPSLDRRERRSAGKSENNDTRTCNTCTGTFPRFLDACPYCGEPIPAPAQRSSVEWVDGDLYELDAATLASMRAAIARVDMDPGAYRDQLQHQGVPHVGVLANVKRLVATQEVVAQLREVEAVWAGYERAAGLSDREIMRKFFSVFGVDLWTAQTWKAAEMSALIERINGSIRR